MNPVSLLYFYSLIKTIFNSVYLQFKIFGKPPYSIDNIRDLIINRIIDYDEIHHGFFDTFLDEHVNEMASNILDKLNGKE